MYKYVLKRLMLLLPVLVGVVLILFTLLYITPGDPASILLGEQARAEDLAALRLQMGLDDPFFVQFFNYVSRVIRLDLGTSYVTKRPVFALIIR